MSGYMGGGFKMNDLKPAKSHVQKRFAHFSFHAVFVSTVIDTW